MTKQEAFDRLDAFEEGIPFEAIRFLYNHDPDPELMDKIRFALTHIYDAKVYYDPETDEFSNATLWYAIVAENHCDLTLLEPLLRIYTDYDEDYDFLHEQGSVLLGKLYEQYGALAVRPVIDAIERMMQSSSNRPYLYLFECFRYADSAYLEQVLSWLDNPNNYWLEPMIVHLGESAQFAGIVPKLRELKVYYESVLEKNKDDYKAQHLLVELNGAIKNLELAGQVGFKTVEPYFKTRSTWDVHYARWEDRFTSEDPKPVSVPDKARKVGRNDPCPCGSGKKFKKCCWRVGVFD